MNREGYSWEFWKVPMRVFRELHKIITATFLSIPLLCFTNYIALFLQNCFPLFSFSTNLGYGFHHQKKIACHQYTNNSSSSSSRCTKKKTGLMYMNELMIFDLLVKIPSLIGLTENISLCAMVFILAKSADLIWFIRLIRLYCVLVI